MEVFAGTWTGQGQTYTAREAKAVPGLLQARENANVIEEPMQSKTHGQERAPRRIWTNAIEEPVQAETHGPE